MYQSNNQTIDTASLELMCIYIENFRCFEKCLINLNANYIFKIEGNTNNESEQEWPTMEILQNHRNTDIFAKYGINLKVICGKNGSGKTTLLWLLEKEQHLSNGRYCVLFKDKNDNFISTKQVSILYKDSKIRIDVWGEYKLSELNSTNVEEEDSLCFPKSIAKFYNYHREMFDDKQQPIFTHFTVNIWNEEKFDIILKEQFGIKDNILEHKNLIEQYPLLAFFLEFSQDNSFEKICEEIRSNITTIADIIALLKKDSNFLTFKNLNKQLLNLMYIKPKPKIYNMNKFSFTSSVCEHQTHDFASFETLSLEIEDICNNALKYFKSLFANKGLHIEESVFAELLYFRPLRKLESGEIRYLGNLSHGEYIDIKNKYCLWPRMTQDARVWFYEDEPDIHLHPEWKRHFLIKYISCIKRIRETLNNQVKDHNFASKKYSILMTTHSPFLLSDIPIEHVVYLEQTNEISKSGLLKTIIRSDMPCTFAGNIGEMFYNNFFMDETIGEFAKQEITEALKDLSNCKVDAKRLQTIESLFDMVGDKLLKNLLKDKLNTFKENK